MEQKEEIVFFPLKKKRHINKIKFLVKKKKKKNTTSHSWKTKPRELNCRDTTIAAGLRPCKESLCPE